MNATENNNTNTTDAEQENTEAKRPVRRKPTPTPFDHPLAFPLLVGGLGLWFGYDGWFNPETKSVGFNQIMFGVCSVVFLLTMYMGLREMKMVREQKAKQNSE